MCQWTPFPYAGEYEFDALRLTDNWSRLHRGDCEPLPEDAAVLQAWVLFHNGDFEKAAQAGLRAGGHGITVANKATCIYANYLEVREKTRFDLFLQAASQAEAQQAADPTNANAWFWQAYALGRYSQGISVAKALAQGVGSKVKTALEQTIRLAPHHADAHFALAAFHAEVIDKVGALIGAMTYGAKINTGLNLFSHALTLNRGSALAMTEYAMGMFMLIGESWMNEANRLYEEAAAYEPIDAMERLGVEMAMIEWRD
ncbi:MAG: hypothetical protein ABIQ90_00865 [Polaromonas sp.]